MELETVNKLYLELSQVVTATTAKELALRAEVARLTLELDEAGSNCSMYKQQVLNAQAREAKLRSALLSLRGPFGWGKGSPQEEAIALPSDDSALMERLKQERLEGYNEGYADADAILTGIDRSLT